MSALHSLETGNDSDGGMISVALLTEEHKAMYKHTEEDSREVIFGEERQRPLNE